MNLFSIGYQALKNAIYDFPFPFENNFAEYARAKVEKELKEDIEESKIATINVDEFTEIKSEEGSFIKNERFPKTKVRLNLPSIRDVIPKLSDGGLLAENTRRVKKSRIEKAPTPKPNEFCPSVLDEEPRFAITSKVGLEFERRISFFSKQIGDRAEEIVIRYLSNTLSPQETETLKWTSRLGETPGWDIEFMDVESNLRAIEVKGTTGNAFPDIELTDNEWQAAQSLRERYSIYLVTDCHSKEPGIQELRNPCEMKEKELLIVRPLLWTIQKS